MYRVCFSEFQFSSCHFSFSFFNVFSTIRVLLFPCLFNFSFRGLIVIFASLSFLFPFLFPCPLFVSLSLFVSVCFFVFLSLFVSLSFLCFLVLYCFHVLCCFLVICSFLVHFCFHVLSMFPCPFLFPCPFSLSLRFDINQFTRSSFQPHCFPFLLVRAFCHLLQNCRGRIGHDQVHEIYCLWNIFPDFMLFST